MVFVMHNLALAAGHVFQHSREIQHVRVIPQDPPAQARFVTVHVAADLHGTDFVAMRSRYAWRCWGWRLRPSECRSPS